MKTTLHFACIALPQLLTTLHQLFDKQPVQWQVTPLHYEMWVTLCADDTTTASDQLQTKLAPYYYASDTNEDLPQWVVRHLIANHQTVTAAESLTAGEFQSTLATVSGASAVFPGGFVTYAEAVKGAMLHIPLAQLQHDGVVSRPTAVAMAEQSRVILDTEFGLGFTGVAGPTTLENQPVGTVWISLAQRQQPTIANLYHFSDDRQAVRKQSVLTGFLLLANALKK